MAKRTAVFISLILVASLFIGFSLLTKTVVLVQKAANENPSPEQVKISNLSSRGFTVSWLTQKAAVGSVVYGTSKENLEKSPSSSKAAYDVRGSANFSQTHYVNLENLQPNTNYYFLIKSGATFFYKTLTESWLPAGITGTQKTTSEINSPGAFNWEESFKPNVIVGQVLTGSGQKAKGAVVFLEIPGKSLLLSFLTDSQGKWVTNLANLTNNNLTQYLTYNAKKDLIRLTAYGDNAEFASMYKPIPNPDDPTNPLILQLSQSFYSQGPIPTIYPSAEIKFKFQAINQKGPDKSITVKIGSLANLTINAASDQKGTYFGLAEKLPFGVFDILLKSPGNLSKKIAGVKIQAGKNSFDFTNYPLVAGDLNSDKVVNVEDLGMLIASFRAIVVKDNPADFNGDGRINSEDLGILINNYRLQGD